MRNVAGTARAPAQQYRFLLVPAIWAGRRSKCAVSSHAPVKASQARRLEYYLHPRLAIFSAPKLSVTSVEFVFYVLSPCVVRKGTWCSPPPSRSLFAISDAHAASTRTHSVGVYIEDLPVATILRLAEQGNAKYQTYLGYMYETGRNFPQDYQLAAYWYRSQPIKGMSMLNTCLGYFMTEARAFR